MAGALRYAVLRAFSFIEDPEPPGRKESEERGRGAQEGGREASRARFSWREALADAAIIAGLNFFSTLCAIGAAQIACAPLEALLAASIAAGFGFFSTLAVKRGLKKH